MNKFAIGMAALTLSATSAAAECGKVSITEMNWASGAIVTSIAKFLMVQGYGCDVTVMPSSTVPAVTSVAETGSPDIVTELWVNSVPIFLELEAEGRVKTLGNVLSDGGVEGWWVPKYVVDAHPETANIDGVLANPELVGGIFYNCPEGWGCRIKNDNLQKAYGFSEAGLEIFNPGSGETLASSLASAYQSKKPWFGYYWAPTSLLGRYDMVLVDVGPFDAEAYKCAADSECTNPQKTAYPAAPVLTGATTDFANREPQIAEMMSKLSFTNQQMGMVLAWQEENKATADEAAVYFLTEFKDVWPNWVNDAAREQLAALIQ